MNSVAIYVFIILISIFSTYLIPSNVYGQQQKASDFLKFKNSILGVSINVPTDWVLVDQGIRKEILVLDIYYFNLILPQSEVFQLMLEIYL